MPFRQPFKFDFTEGDLVYGLAPMRKRLITHFAAALMRTGGPGTVDQYRKSTMAALRPEDRKTLKNFVRSNETDKQYGRFAQAIRAYGDDEDRFAAATTNEQLKNSVWRAKSKFGMKWTIENQRGHIHFLLNEIDMPAVVEKTHSFLNPQNPREILAQDLPRGKALTSTKERTITHSELRWIFRNRKNPLVAERVQFWHEVGGIMQPCSPPWSTDNHSTAMVDGQPRQWCLLWSRYVPTAEPEVF